MKFADKLFLLTTALLILIFTLFGTWMLQVNFSQVLNREIEQGNRENNMVQYLFEMGYQASKEYGDDYAIGRTLSSIASYVERNGSRLFAVRKEGLSEDEYLYGYDSVEKAALLEEVQALMISLNEENNYGYCIRQTETGYYMLMLTLLTETEEPLFRGVYRDLTAIYGDRENLLVQYRFALAVLLFAGGTAVYVLSRYITRPIRKLGRIAEKIAEGNYVLRSHNKNSDEIGQLARNFDKMADRLLRELDAKVLEAEQKENFTAAFAHELKTPLTSIIGYADMLNSMKMTEEENREAYFYIYSQGKRLESLSHKLLELVSMDKNPIEFKPVPTKYLEENIRATTRPIWNQRGIQGKIALERATLYGDGELLLSLFYNLLDNAAKAMDHGTIDFILMKGRIVDDEYEIKVVDNGRGIPAEEISRITEAFYMVDKSRSRKEGGAGIGMALCVKIADLHGAKLKIDSKLGEGTVIKLLFPLRRK